MAGLQFVLKDGLLPLNLLRTHDAYDMHIERKTEAVNPFQPRKRVGQLTLGDFA